MSTKALAQLVEHHSGSGTGWVPLHVLAARLGWSPQQQRSQLSTLQATLEQRPWYLALIPTSAGPTVDADALFLRARQLLHGYREGVA